jgi:hypothetical protein
VIGDLVTVVQSLTTGNAVLDLSVLNGPALKLLGLFLTQGIDIPS